MPRQNDARGACSTSRATRANSWHVLVHATAARRVLEIGTSNGLLHPLARRCRAGIGGSGDYGRARRRQDPARRGQLRALGLSPFITLVHDDAGRLLQRSDPSAYDLIFLDSERPEYPGWWPHLRRILRPGGLLIVDNATSHVQEMAPFVALVRADPEFSTCLVQSARASSLPIEDAVVSAEVSNVRSRWNTGPTREDERVSWGRLQASPTTSWRRSTRSGSMTRASGQGA